MLRERTGVAVLMVKGVTERKILRVKRTAVRTSEEWELRREEGS